MHTNVRNSQQSKKHTQPGMGYGLFCRARSEAEYNGETTSPFSTLKKTSHPLGSTFLKNGFELAQCCIRLTSAGALTPNNRKQITASVKVSALHWDYGTATCFRSMRNVLRVHVYIRQALRQRSIVPLCIASDGHRPDVQIKVTLR